MKPFAAFTLSALFVLLFSPLTHGRGDFNTVGSAPRPVYKPENPTDYFCKIKLAYRIDRQMAEAEYETSFSKDQLKTSGIAVYSVNDPARPYFKGQFIRLSFNQNENGSEEAQLDVNAVLENKVDKLTGVATVQAPVGTRLEALAEAGRESKAKRPYRVMSVKAECDPR